MCAQHAESIDWYVSISIWVCIWASKCALIQHRIESASKCATEHPDVHMSVRMRSDSEQNSFSIRMRNWASGCAVIQHSVESASRCAFEHPDVHIIPVQGSLYLTWPGQNTAEVCATDLTRSPRWSTRKVYPVKVHPSTSDTMFYPWVTVFITVRITKAFGLPKPSLFSKYKVMLLLCHLRINWIEIQNFPLRWLDVISHVIWMHYADWMLLVTWSEQRNFWRLLWRPCAWANVQLHVRTCNSSAVRNFSIRMRKCTSV